ncbi:helix-turn-helix transcriptional regulator [uncultured Microbacterium sp.]|uniref:helix-turn-helix domain-containing protein n=1 Tax=uncultured Microbacterium sp. TaxID=191216 RepID=UPI0025D2AA2E|nr:helix-turn-helix transcriptional regulator [uncultured Microbacterium sp.]
MTNVDAQIGANLQILRGEMSQTTLAARMKSAGHKWSQPTVVAVEKGERPLRLAEAADLAATLGIDVADLIRVPTHFAFFGALIAAESADNHLIQAANAYRRAIDRLRSVVAQHEAQHGRGSLDGELLDWDLNEPVAARVWRVVDTDVLPGDPDPVVDTLRSTYRG